MIRQQGLHLVTLIELVGWLWYSFFHKMYSSTNLSARPLLVRGAKGASELVQSPLPSSRRQHHSPVRRLESRASQHRMPLGF